MERYRCPNATHEISRAVHLARLAAFDAACRACPHRHEAQLLPPSVRRTWQKLQAANGERGLASCDGVVFGTLHNEVSPAVVRQYAWAWGHYVLAREAREAAGSGAASAFTSAGQVAIAGDGRPETVPLLAAACEGLRMAGCHVLELGTGTAPLVAAFVAQCAAAGAIFVGNPPGFPHTAGLCLLGSGGMPAGHAALSAALAHAPKTMRHRGGRWQAVPYAPAYLKRLKGFYHGLRPLRFVLHSTCRPLLQWIQELTQHTGCTALCTQPQLACPSLEVAAREKVPSRAPSQPQPASSEAMCLQHADAGPPALQEPMRPQEARRPQEPHAAIRSAPLSHAPLLTPDAAAWLTARSEEMPAASHAPLLTPDAAAWLTARSEEMPAASHAPLLIPDAAALAATKRQVIESGAHFGMWCDGDGRRCYMLDERGNLVPPERLLQVLAGLLSIWSAGSPPVVVVEETCDVQTIQQLALLGLRVHQAAPGQHSIWQAMIEHGAALGGGPSGCLWVSFEAFANVALPGYLEGPNAPSAPAIASACPATVASFGPQLDALAVLTLWLHVLSRQSLPASEVLEQPLRVLTGQGAGGSGFGKSSLQPYCQ